jgi:hypothetical protein
MSSKKPSTIFLTPPVCGEGGGFSFTAILPLHHYGTKIAVATLEKVYIHILLRLSIMKVEEKNSTEKSRRRRIYTIQPYAVGSKGGKSLALVIPAGIARQCDITTDTVFSVKADERTNAVTLQTVKLMTTTEDGGDENKTKAGAEGGATNNNLSAATL